MQTNFHQLVGNNLPIFRSNQGMESWFYTPGYLVVTEAEQADLFEAHLLASSPSHPSAAELVNLARLTLLRWEALQMQPFSPVCLTLYLNNSCNLACSYCYSQPAIEHSPRLSPEVIRAATELVAENCLTNGWRMTVVFHGGGEPSLEREQLEQALEIAEQAASERSLELFRYIATNGVMAEEKATWLAEHLDMIGLSCDGPMDIQSRQRPLHSGRSSTTWVESTARIVNQAGKPLHVRTTITPDSMMRQSEIASYLCEQLQPSEIHVEPLYQVGLANEQNCFAPDQAQAFVSEFLRAREVAGKHGARWTTSGSRPAEIHGAYCHVFRDVLNLTPEGVATACFCISRAADLQPSGLQIGNVNLEARRYELDFKRIDELQRKLSYQLIKCSGCFNQFHCTRGCPDMCLADDPDGARGEFRCQVNQRLAEAIVAGCAEELRKQPPDFDGVRSGAVNNL
jgi:uncharacterized protein